MKIEREKSEETLLVGVSEKKCAMHEIPRGDSEDTRKMSARCEKHRDSKKLVETNKRSKDCCEKREEEEMTHQSPEWRLGLEVEHLERLSEAVVGSRWLSQAVCHRNPLMKRRAKEKVEGCFQGLLGEWLVNLC